MQGGSMISAISTIGDKLTHRVGHTSSPKKTSAKHSKSSDKIIKHAPPAKSREEILAKLRKKHINIGKTEKEDIINPEESELLKDQSSTRERLKKLLNTGGAMMFNEKERSVLAEILNK